MVSLVLIAYRDSVFVYSLELRSKQQICLHRSIGRIHHTCCVDPTGELAARLRWILREFEEASIRHQLGNNHRLPDFENYFVVCSATDPV